MFRRRQTSSGGLSGGGNVSATASSPHFLNLPWLTVQEAMMIGILVVAMVVLSFTSDRFLTPANLLNQVRFLTETALLAVPMTFIIILGGIDLSVGSMVALSAILLGFSWQTFHLPLWLAVIVGIVGATLAGCLNGLAIVWSGRAQTSPS